LTGGANEVWSFGERIYGILKDLFFLRERMKPYIKEQMRRCCDEGIPLMRPLFFNFRSDENTYEVEDEFMFGSDVLAAPICEEGAKNRRVYLPKGASGPTPERTKLMKVDSGSPAKHPWK